ncbi:hypothetical protein Adt_23940 [Abeliophyllum distichum]|uniref:DUF4408 domain-containing protein n=1 Tax=Abeliophyllum distichum TaxID=126358 RepID=A0ABD1SCR2_9LAMI
MESQVFINVNFEKAKTIARFNLFQIIAKPFQFLQVLVVCALVFLSLKHIDIPTVVRILSKRSAYLFNYHVVFLTWNAIIVLLFVLCRQNELSRNHSAAGDLFDDCVKHSEVHQCLSSVSISTTENELIPPDGEDGGGDEGIEEKRILCTDYNINSVAKCDEVTMVIEKATWQIKRFQWKQSEKLKREIAVKPMRKLRRSETENIRMTPIAGADIETLSNEEFQRTVQAFIYKHRRFFLEQKLAESK